MEYLTRLLGIKVTEQNNNQFTFPHYLNSRYEIMSVKLDQYPVIFMYTKDQLDPITSLKKHIEKVVQITNMKVVLISSNLTYRIREQLLNNHIAFIVEGKQIYLPFMGTYLQEKFNPEINYKNKLLPSSQLLLLYYLYSDSKDVIVSKAAKDLDLTPMSISRAARELEHFQLLNSHQKGRSKVIYSNLSKRELFDLSKPYMENPVKKTVYIDQSELNDHLLVSSYSALSTYSFLNEPSIRYYATHRISDFKTITNQLIDESSQVALDNYRYDPTKLTNGNCVDILSLVLSLEDNQDERIRKEVEKMLVNLWRN